MRLTDKPLTAADEEALTRALAVTRAENPGRRQQVDSMVADPSRSWQEVAVFAASCAQNRSLNLMPWQLPPYCASLADLDQPPGDVSGRHESAALCSGCCAPTSVRSSQIRLMRFSVSSSGGRRSEDAHHATKKDFNGDDAVVSYLINKGDNHEACSNGTSVCARALQHLRICAHGSSQAERQEPYSCVVSRLASEISQSERQRSRVVPSNTSAHWII